MSPSAAFLFSFRCADVIKTRQRQALAPLHLTESIKVGFDVTQCSLT